MNDTIEKIKGWKISETLSESEWRASLVERLFLIRSGEGELERLARLHHLATAVDIHSRYPILASAVFLLIDSLLVTFGGYSAPLYMVLAKYGMVVGVAMATSTFFTMRALRGQANIVSRQIMSLVYSRRFLRDYLLRQLPHEVDKYYRLNHHGDIRKVLYHSAYKDVFDEVLTYRMGGV